MKKIYYNNGIIEVSVKNYQTFEKLKKKLCSRFCLGLDTVLVDEEKRIVRSDLLIQNYDGKIWIPLNNFGEMINVSLIRTTYEIEFMDKNYIFEAVICNAWNRTFVVYYINLLIGGIQRKTEIRIDGVLWTEGLLSVWPIKEKNSATIGKKSLLIKSNFWIANRKLLEIKFVRIDGGNKFKRLLSYWSKVTLEFAIHI
jgi:hypothetical protein